MTPFIFKLVHHHHHHLDGIADSKQKVLSKNNICDCDLHKFTFNDTFKPKKIVVTSTQTVLNTKKVISEYDLLHSQSFLDFSNHLRGPPSLLF